MDQELVIAFISFVLAWVVPPLVDLIRRKFEVTNPKRAQILTGIVAVGVAAGNLFVTRELNASLASWILNASLIMATAQTVYKQFWEKSELRGQLFPSVVH